MIKQEVISQRKGQDKTPVKQANEVETGNLPKKEFRVMIVKMMQDLKDRADGRNVTKHLEELKNIQTGMNNMLEGIKSRIRGRRIEK